MSAGEELSLRIAAELAAARLARERGNEGMVRVCARRAAGAAITGWKRGTPAGQTRDVISLLRGFGNTAGIPQPVRDAAQRLTTRVGPDFVPAHPEDPIEDARSIIAYCAENGPEG